jgi:FkbM family methyltransferase
VLRSVRALFGGGERDRPSTVAIGSFEGFAVAYRKGTADEPVISHSFGNDLFFANVPQYQPREHDVIIDVGAHIGTFSLLAASKVRQGHVHAIEASQDTFNFLRINVALNRCTNVTAHRLALADRNGTCTLFHDAENWGHSVVSAEAATSETVDCATLETFLQRNTIDRCQFMKLNCEGAEFPILLTSPKRVLERVDCMLVLYHCDLWTKGSEADLVRHLEACGFSCVVRQQSEQRGWIVATRGTARA